MLITTFYIMHSMVNIDEVVIINHGIQGRMQRCLPGVVEGRVSGRENQLGVWRAL